MKHTKLFAIVGILVGGIGAAGQAWLLSHELFECYPYKVMSSPSPEFYFQTGAIGSYLSPLLAMAVMAALFFASRRIWTIWVTPVAACPLVYTIIFLARDAAWNGPVVRNFDGTTQSDVAIGFVVYSLELAIVGSVVAAVSWAVCSQLIKRSSLR